MEISVSPPGWEQVELIEDVTCEVKRLSLVESMAVDKVVQEPYLRAVTKSGVNREEAVNDAMAEDTLFSDRYFGIFKQYVRDFRNLVVDGENVSTPEHLLDFGLGSSPELKEIYVTALRHFIEINRIGEIQIKNSDRPPESGSTGGQDNSTTG